MEHINLICSSATKLRTYNSRNMLPLFSFCRLSPIFVRLMIFSSKRLHSSLVSGTFMLGGDGSSVIYKNRYVTFHFCYMQHVMIISIFSQFENKLICIIKQVSLDNNKQHLSLEWHNLFIS